MDVRGETPRQGQSRLPAPVSWIQDLWRVCGVIRRLTQLFRRRGYDVVDLHVSRAILVGGLAARLAGVKTVIAQIFMLDFWQYGPGRFLRHMVPLLADVIVTDSAARARDLEVLFGRRVRVAVVPNGLWPPAPGLTRRDSRKMLGIPDDEDIRVLAQLSRLVPEKGLEVLLHAARRVIGEEPRAFFMICGYDWQNDGYAEQLRRLARELGIEDCVRIGGSDRVEDVWPAVDIYVHASPSESSPMAVLESMALGLPAAVVSTGGVPELVEDGVTGLLVEPGDVVGLAAALIRFLREPETGRLLGAAARKRYTECHQPEIASRRFEAVIEEMLSRD